MKIFKTMLSYYDLSKNIKNNKFFDITNELDVDEILFDYVSRDNQVYQKLSNFQIENSLFDFNKYLYNNKYEFKSIEKAKRMYNVLVSLINDGYIKKYIFLKSSNDHKTNNIKKIEELLSIPADYILIPLNDNKYIIDYCHHHLIDNDHAYKLNIQYI